MDWENKFYKLVKETETNIAKAKDKLSGSNNKVQASNRRLYSGNRSSDHLRTANLPELLSVQPTIYNRTLYPFDENILFTMSSEQRRQILKMKEQIESQNRTMEKLHRLIKTLDQERDYYKQQIALLKDQVDLLTDKIDSNFDLNNSDRKMAMIKKEVMHEIEKVKSIKENFSHNLDRLCDDLDLMNKRIDRMENYQLSDPALSPLSLNKKYTSVHNQNPEHLFSSTYSDINSFELQKLRLAIGSMNSKLDTLEKKIDRPHLTSTFSRRTSYQKTPQSLNYLRKLSLEKSREENDLESSLSDLSSIVSLAEEDEEESYHSSKHSYIRGKSKYRSQKRVKPELELSDLDLSDEDDLSFDADYLDV
ncbi:hypothetical protein Bpfe_007560 [Biomphalaria pfeifferi]|uniref:Uncharacterized protein n=1 Tax=Biomphalaria pfeifferi TaxID=112525 RepID=A0AAD8FFU2_BIOPF|nr:hypothetical protein Bpfe_007560 [Biomphalaria pfeifferi]